MPTKRAASFHTPTESASTIRTGITVPFNDIGEPGAYYCHSTGWLYRVPDDVLSLGHSPVMNIVTGDDMFVTKISEDPWVPLNKARQLCANKDYGVNF